MTTISTTGASAISQLFQKADTNQNKSLSLDEFTQLGKGITQDGLGSIAGTGGSRNGPTVADVFKSLDTNGDGQLSAAEFTDGAELADKVKSALLSAQEITSGGTLLQLLSGTSDDKNGTDFSSLFNPTSTAANNPNSLASAIQKWLDVYAANNTSDDTTPTTGVKTTA